MIESLQMQILKVFYTFPSVVSFFFWYVFLEAATPSLSLSMWGSCPRVLCGTTPKTDFFFSLLLLLLLLFLLLFYVVTPPHMLCFI